jgi:transposase
VLSAVRTRLVGGHAAQRLRDTVLRRVRERGLLKAHGRQRTDSTHVRVALRVLNRLELVGETRRHALNRLAGVAPDWLRTQAPPAWFAREGRRIEHSHLPNTTAAREEVAATIGGDGPRLLQAIKAATDQPGRREIPAVQTQRRVWTAPDTDPPGPRRWRTVQERAPAAAVIASPDDPDAR